MLYEFHKDIQRLLAERKYPVQVRYHERFTRDTCREGHAIIVEHDTDSGDQLQPPRGAQGNPPKYFDRMIGAKATVYARSSLPNAHRGDHERECEKVIDAFTSAFKKWCTAGRVTTATVGKMGYVPPKPDEGPEVWSGVKYEIHFALPRGVYDREYAGEQNAGNANPTGAASGVANRTDASAPGYNPETGCDST